jgi:hypothetical protein
MVGVGGCGRLRCCDDVEKTVPGGAACFVLGAHCLLCAQTGKALFSAGIWRAGAVHRLCIISHCHETPQQKPTDTHNNRRSSGFKKMASWESFDAVFYFDRNYAHDKKTLDRIVANRRSLQNQLFIDRLLQLMGVKPGSKQRSGHFCLAYLLNNG